MVTFKEFKYFAEHLSSLDFSSCHEGPRSCFSFTTSMFVHSDLEKVVNFLGDSFKGFTIYPSTDKLEVVVDFYCDFINV